MECEDGKKEKAEGQNKERQSTIPFTIRFTLKLNPRAIIQYDTTYNLIHKKQNARGKSSKTQKTASSEKGKA